jgi:Uma2 family endonuclease
MNALIRSAQYALAGRQDAFVGGNMLVYYSRDQAINRDFRGPDFFVAMDVAPDRERKSWIVWEEGAGE